MAGTAGWEALRKGKPAVFGGGWWRDFSGFFPSEPGMNLATIAETTFPHDALEQAFGDLQARCHKGVIDLLSQNRTEVLDHAANAEAVAASLYGLLTGTLPMTFFRKGRP